MRNTLMIAALAVLLPGAGMGAAQAKEEPQEKKVKLEELPRAVQQAVKQHSAGAKLRGLTQETENGKTFYEAELDVNGRTRDVTFDAAGKVVSVEEEIPLDKVPAAARNAIQKSVGTGKLILVEIIKEGGKTFYEAHIQPAGGGAEVEVKVDAAGKPVE